MHKQFMNDAASGKGNALIEYTAIGLVVMAACIVAVTAFGEDFNMQLSGLTAEAQAQSEKAAFADAQVKAAAAIAAVTHGPGAHLAAGNDEDGLNSEDGLVQTTGSGGSTMNSGINGSTGTAGGTVDKTPETEKQLKRMLKELANEAHKVAYLQALVESVSSYSNGDKTKLQSSMISYDGMLVNAYQLSYALNNGGEIISLENKKNAVLASAVASDDVKGAVAELTDKIKESAKNTSAQAEIALSSSGPAAAITKLSDETHVDAGKICTTGGGIDIGTSCGKPAADKEDDKEEDIK